MSKELKPVITPIKFEQEIAKNIYSFLLESLLQPLLDEFKEKKGLYYNSAINNITRAIRSGRIGYDQGIVKGSFNVAIIKEFNKLGFKFDQRIKGFRVNINQLPVELQLTIGKANYAGKRLATSLLDKINNLNIEEKIINFNLQDKYYQILDNIDDNLTKSISQVIGLDIKTTQAQKLKISEEFTNNMKLFIKDFANNEIVKLREQVEQSAFSGVRAESLQRTIEKSFGVSQNKSLFLAKQEIGLFTSFYKEAKYKELGITKYRWSTSRDVRVREDHQDLNNKIFSFNNPPIVNKQTGKRANPSQDFGCRCVAIPIID